MTPTDNNFVVTNQKKIAQSKPHAEPNFLETDLAKRLRVVVYLSFFILAPRYGFKTPKRKS